MNEDINFEDHIAEEARLTILKELARQTDGRLNEKVLTAVLDQFGYNKSREWVRTQMRKLAELGAVRIAEVGGAGFLVASITRTGIDHVERRSILEGVARPSPEL